MAICFWRCTKLPLLLLNFSDRTRSLLWRGDEQNSQKTVYICYRKFNCLSLPPTRYAPSSLTFWFIWVCLSNLDSSHQKKEHRNKRSHDWSKQADNAMQYCCIHYLNTWIAIFSSFYLKTRQNSVGGSIGLGKVGECVEGEGKAACGERRACVLWWLGVF